VTTQLQLINIIIIIIIIIITVVAYVSNLCRLKIHESHYN